MNNFKGAILDVMPNGWDDKNLPDAKQWRHEKIYKGFIDYIGGDSSGLIEADIDTTSYEDIVKREAYGLARVEGFIIAFGIGALYLDNEKTRLMRANNPKQPAMAVELGYNLPMFYGLMWIAVILSLNGKKLSKLTYTTPRRVLGSDDISANSSLRITAQNNGDGTGSTPIGP